METLQRTANRGSISTGFDIDNSVKVENDNREYFRWTNFSNYASSARKKKFSMSVWVKRTELDRQQIVWSTAANGYLSFQADNKIKWQQTYSGVQKTLNTNRVFRDTSAWYHILLQVDTAQSTEADRTKLYVNGEQITSFSSATYPSQNDEAQNLYEQHLILGEWGGGSTGFSGYIAEYYFLSEVALVPSDVGETDEDTGIWKPKAYSGTISSPSQFLEFKDSSDLGTATSGLDADYLNNITAIDQATDTPTNNFCTFNAIQNYTPSTVLSDGGTLWDNPAGQNWQSITGTFAVASGKWYWEVRGATYAFLGIADVDDTIIPRNVNGYYLGNGDNNSATTKSIGMYSINGQVYNAPNGSPDGTSYTSANMIGFALDMDNRKMWISKDGTWISSIGDPTGTPSGGIALTYLGDYIYPAVSVSASNGVICAFGGIVSPHVSHHNMTNTDANGYGAFKSSPPSGYYALCTKNLAEYG